MKKEQQEVLETIPMPTGDLSGSEVLGAVKVPAVVAKYREGRTGLEEIKLGFIIGDEVRFLDHKVLSKPANKWLRDGIFNILEKEGKGKKHA